MHHFPITFFRNALESVNGEMWEGKTGVRERTFNFAEQLFPFLCDFNSLFNAFSICTMEAVNWEKGEGAHGTQEGGKKGLFNFFADSLSSLRDAPNILLRKSNLWCKIWTQKYKFFMICGQHIILWKPRRPKCTIGLDRKVQAVRMRKGIKRKMCVLSSTDNRGMRTNRPNAAWLPTDPPQKLDWPASYHNVYLQIASQREGTFTLVTFVPVGTKKLPPQNG